MRRGNPDDLRAVTAGDKITALGMDYVVKAPCADKNSGRWFCVTHQAGFRNQWDKDTHISAKKYKCVLLWACLEHGAEQP